MSIESLKLKVAAEKAITTVGKEITPISLFATSFNALNGNKGATIAVPVFKIGAAGDFNADSNNYAGKTQDVEGVDVNLDQHIVKSIYYTDRNNAETDVRWFEGAGSALAESIGRSIVTKVLGQCTAGNVTKKTVLKEADFINKQKVAALGAVCAKENMDMTRCVLVLNPVAFQNVCSTLDANVYGGTEAIRTGVIEGLYGFKGVVKSADLPVDAKNGLIVDTEAIGVASRYLEPDAEVYTEVGMVTDDNTGLTLGFRRFSDPATGRRYIAAECLYGTKLIQPDKAIRIVEA